MKFSGSKFSGFKNPRQEIARAKSEFQKVILSETLRAIKHYETRLKGSVRNHSVQNKCFSLDLQITSPACGRHRRHGACAHYAGQDRPHADRRLYTADCHTADRRQVPDGCGDDEHGEQELQEVHQWAGPEAEPQSDWPSECPEVPLVPSRLSPGTGRSWGDWHWRGSSSLGCRSLLQVQRRWVRSSSRRLVRRKCWADASSTSARTAIRRRRAARGSSAKKLRASSQWAENMPNCK